MVLLFGPVFSVAYYPGNFSADALDFDYLFWSAGLGDKLATPLSLILKPEVIEN